MRKLTTAGTVLALSLAFAATVSADSNTTTFDGFADGSVNGQGGWTADSTYDQAIEGVPGDKALRISNEVTDGSFAGMPYSAPVAIPAGESEANNVLTNEFTFQAPATFTPGLAMSISPTGAGGSRMSYVRLEDSVDGVKVVFRDGTFSDQLIDTLDRSVPHTIKFETTFVRGDDNDVVRLFVDGTPRMRGASWENYYRSDEHRNPAVTDRLMWRLNLAPSGADCVSDAPRCHAPALHGNGFLFDDVTTESYHVNNPAPLNPPAPGPQGPQGPAGQNGTDGVNGVTTVTTVIHDRGKLTGNSVRTLHARKIKGEEFISVRASLRGKRLHAHGRSVKVDLRGKTVGNYHVVMVAKYKTKSTGKIHTVRSIRTVSIFRK
jgi:hypothetical protein